MAIRVFELARELGVRSKEVLTKCRAEGLEIKNHMATLSAGLEATIREWFSEVINGSTALEVSEHVDLVSARARAKKVRRKKQAKVEIEPVEPEQVEPSVEAVPTLAAQAAAVEQGPEPLAEAAGSETPQAQQAESDESGEARQGQGQPAITEDEEPPKKIQEPKVVIKAVGPQVVPRPAMVKGPRVVRVEKPDYVSIPRRRQATPVSRVAQAPTPSVATPSSTTKRGKRGSQKDGEEDSTKTAKKSRRHSPRRRGGRTADSR